MDNAIPRLRVPYTKKLEMMQVPVEHLVEERQGRGRKHLDYLPWVEAQLLLEEYFPTFEVNFVLSAEGVPYFKDETGYYVLAFILDTESGLETPAMFYPVMDNNHGPVSQPSMNQINMALWRASVKVIAVTTGIGLSIFRRLKEDVPDEQPAYEPKRGKQQQDEWNAEDLAPQSAPQSNGKKMQFGRKVS